MSLILRIGLAAAMLATPLMTHAAMAEIEVHDPYARASTAMSTSGAAFMMILNRGDQDDRLIAVSTDAAQRSELHTHLEDANGVMKMVHVEEGFDLPEGGEIAMIRGGKHVMLLGLTGALEQGDEITITLTFEKAGDIEVTVPVDLERKPDHGDKMN